MKLEERFNNWIYTIPKNKETLVYDFYLLASLPEPKDDNLKYILKDSKTVMFSYLKEFMLNALLQVISDEFLHVFDINKKEDVLKYLSDSGIEFRESNGSFKIIGTNLRFVEVSEQMFLDLKWYDKFGGKPWAKICEAYVNLYNTKETELGPLSAQIDHIYDLEHNTGNIFTKFQDYGFLRKVLDHKAEIKSLYEYFDLVSIDLKDFAAAVIKDSQGTDFEGWSMGKNSNREFYRTGEDVEIVNEKYAYKYIPIYVNNFKCKLEEMVMRGTKATVENNFKYTPIFPLNRLYLLKQNNKYILIDERGIRKQSFKLLLD